MKRSPQNIGLHYRKFFGIIPSRSFSTMWAKFPERFQSKKQIMKDSHLYARIVVKTATLVTSRRCTPKLGSLRNHDGYDDESVT